MEAELKKANRLIITILLVLSSAVTLCGFSTFRNETGEENANIISGKTPIDTERSGAIWHRSFSEDTISYNSVPVIRGQVIYVVNQNKLFELNKQGAILRQMTLSANMNSVCNLYNQGDYLYIPLDGGRIQCIRCSDMRSVWVSEAFGGQSLSTVYYHQGYLYAGTTNTPAGKTTGIFYCLDASDGHTIWTYEDTETPGGYYWSGGIVKGNAIFFSGDNGILVSHSLLEDEVYDTWTLTETGKVRAGITCDAESGALYTTSNDGRIHRIEVTENGKIQTVLSKKMVSSAKTANCTSTPSIWKNRLYVGSMADGCGYIHVLNATTLEHHYSVSTGQFKEVKASPLVSTGYAAKGNNETVYIYFTCNALPGGIYMIKDSQSATSASLQTLFVPDKKQFCISSVAADTDGTLYYSNDSGNLFAVQGLVSIKKPGNVKWKKKKGKWIWTLSFKKNEPEAQTLVYVRYNSGKWKKIGTTNSSKYRATLKNRKKIRIRLRNRQKNSNKKWVYSPYTKSYRIR